MCAAVTECGAPAYAETACDTSTDATTQQSTDSTAVTLVAANADILPGYLVTGTGIVGSVTVDSITGTALTLSSAQTIGAAVVLSFRTAPVWGGLYYEAEAPTLVTDRVCAEKTICTPSQFELLPVALVSDDRMCCTLSVAALQGLTAHSRSSPAAGLLRWRQRRDEPDRTSGMRGQHRRHGLVRLRCAHVAPG